MELGRPRHTAPLVRVMDKAAFSDPSVRELKDKGFNIKGLLRPWSDEEVRLLWEGYKTSLQHNVKGQYANPHYYVSHYALHGTRTAAECRRLLMKLLNAADPESGAQPGDAASVTASPPASAPQPDSDTAAPARESLAAAAPPAPATSSSPTAVSQSARAAPPQVALAPPPVAEPPASRDLLAAANPHPPLATRKRPRPPQRLQSSSPATGRKPGKRPAATALSVSASQSAEANASPPTTVHVHPPPPEQPAGSGRRAADARGAASRLQRTCKLPDRFAPEPPPRDPADRAKRSRVDPRPQDSPGDGGGG